MGSGRFCWRERTQKVQWRSLRSLDLQQVVQKGTPATLEPHALHLTFAWLPEAPTELDAVTEPRALGWFVARVLQLSMEYLLYLRSRDGNVLQSLRKELEWCERERKTMEKRADKWKRRSKTEEARVEKLHQVVHNVARVLQLKGATPGAVETIEALLSNLLIKFPKKTTDENSDISNNGLDDKDVPIDDTVQQGRLCGYCGKMFSTEHFLRQHLQRRHEHEMNKSVTKEPSTDENTKADLVEKTSEIQEKKEVSGIQDLIQQFVCVLQTHEQTIQTTVEGEREKMMGMYERFVSDKEAFYKLQKECEELKAENKRLDDDLSSLRTQHENALTELDRLRQKISKADENQDIDTIKTDLVKTAWSPHATAYEEQVESLMKELFECKQALEKEREERKKGNDQYMEEVGRRQAVESELEKSTEIIKSLEEKLENERCSKKNLVDVKEDETQTIAIAMDETSTQTSETQTQSTASQTFNEMVDMDCQTEALKMKAQITQYPDDGGYEVIDTAVGTSGQHLAAVIAQSELEQEHYSTAILESVQLRAERSGRVSRIQDEGSAKPESLTWRPYLPMRFKHPESALIERMETCFKQLHSMAGRYGISRDEALLEDDQFQVAQHALEGHLTVLPLATLKQMITCDAIVNNIVQEHWHASERIRQEAHDRFKNDKRQDMQQIQTLVHQAMHVVLNKDSSMSEEDKKPTDDVSEVQEMKTPEPVLNVVTEAKDAENSLNESKEEVEEDKVAQDLLTAELSQADPDVQRNQLPVVSSNTAIPGHAMEDESEEEKESSSGHLQDDSLHTEEMKYTEAEMNDSQEDPEDDEIWAPTLRNPSANSLDVKDSPVENPKEISDAIDNVVDMIEEKQDILVETSEDANAILSQKPFNISMLQVGNEASEQEEELDTLGLPTLEVKVSNRTSEVDVDARACSSISERQIESNVNVDKQPDLPTFLDLTSPKSSVASSVHLERETELTLVTTSVNYLDEQVPREEESKMEELVQRIHYDAITALSFDDADIEEIELG